MDITSPLPPPNRARSENAVKASIGINRAISSFQNNKGKRPEGHEKPTYGTQEYFTWIFFDWISPEEQAEDRKIADAKVLEGVNNSLKINLNEELELEETAPPEDTNEYIPEKSAIILNDKRLKTRDRDVLEFMMKEAHKFCRESRTIQATKSFIANGMGISISTVGRALGRLQFCGYIDRLIISNVKTRMCDGLMIFINSICYPKHRIKHRVIKNKKMVNGRKQGTSKMGQKYKQNILKKENSALITVQEWNMKIYNGLIRAKIKLLS